MSRNRMKNSQSLHWMGVVKWVLIAGMMSMLGLSYMLCKNQNMKLAQDVHHLQIDLTSIDKRNKQLSIDLDSMKSPTRLQRRLALMHSTLVRLSDMGQMVVNMDGNVRARLAHLGTIPQGAIDYSSAPVASSGTPTIVSPPLQDSN